MEISNKDEYLQRFKVKYGRNEEAAEKADWIEKIANLTQLIPKDKIDDPQKLKNWRWMVIFGKVQHLNKDWIKKLYLDAKTADGHENQCKRFWWLLKQTKVDFQPNKWKERIKDGNYKQRVKESE